MTNKYLEKVALNALAARTMAKQVGVHPIGNWKYALRNLRSGSGAPLQGKALADKRLAMGDFSNNGYQKIKSLESKSPIGSEMSGSLNKGIPKLMNTSSARIANVPYEKGVHNFHTHPNIFTRGKVKGDYITQQEHSIRNLKSTKDPMGASLSGFHVNDEATTRSLTKSKKLRESLNSRWGEETERKAGDKLRRVSDISSRILYRDVRYGTPAYKQNEKLMDRAQNLTDNIIDRLHKTRETPRIVSSRYDHRQDVGSGDIVPFRKDPDTLHRIAHTGSSTVSVNKIRGEGVRSVYFDHTPKKMK